MIAGLGGNGAQLLDEAAGIGLGADASYTLIDDDQIDATNLSRIPYVYEADIGRPKAQHRQRGRVGYSLGVKTSDEEWFRSLPDTNTLLICDI